MAEEHSANAAAAETEPLQEEPADDGSMSLTKHLEELRNRIIRSLQQVRDILSQDMTGSPGAANADLHSLSVLSLNN